MHPRRRWMRGLTRGGNVTSSWTPPPFRPLKRGHRNEVLADVESIAGCDRGGKAS